MKDKTVTITVTQKLADEFSALYKNHTAGMRLSAETFMQLRTSTMYELKGKFTKPEIIALTDNLNGTMMQVEYATNGNMLIAHIEDGEKYEGVCSKHGANLNDLSAKIASLTSAQVLFLQDEINRFWNEPKAYGSPTPDLDKFIEAMQ